MAEDEIQVLPKTSCALRNNKVVACDDYFVNRTERSSETTPAARHAAGTNS